MIVGSTVWSGCYTQLAIGSDSTASEAESDTTITNQLTAINEITQSVFIDNPWVVGPFAPVYFSPFVKRTHFRKKGVATTYRPLPFAGTPSVSSATASPAPSPHRLSGYQRSSSP